MIGSRFGAKNAKDTFDFVTRYLGFGKYDIMIYKPLPRHKDWNAISTSPFAFHLVQSSKECIVLSEN